jgi:predicted Zn-dependent protease
MPFPSRLAERLERLVSRSTADSTEVSWIEVRRRGGSPERTLSIRVRESGRTGLHETGVDEPSELENALRDAQAQARLAPPTAAFPLAPSQAGDAGLTPDDLYDPAIGELDPASARGWLESHFPPGSGARFGWSVAEVGFFHSKGARQVAVVTAATLSAGGEVRAARRLDGLDVEALSGAVARHTAAEAGEPWAGPPEVLVLAPQAVAALLRFLNRQALSADAFRGGSSPLLARLGEAILPPLFTVRDDATDRTGLPLPFDHAGWPKRPVSLVEAGIFRTPAVDAGLSASLGLPLTPHALSFSDAAASHLSLVPPAGTAGTGLAGQNGILWIETASPLEPVGTGLRFRTRLGGVRRLAGRELGSPGPDLVWEGELLDVLAGTLEVGAAAVAVAGGGDLLGATTAPPLAIEARGTFSPGPGRLSSQTV